jgi:hypothetical protein
LLVHPLLGKRVITSFIDCDGWAAPTDAAGVDQLTMTTG